MPLSPTTINRVTNSILNPTHHTAVVVEKPRSMTKLQTGKTLRDQSLNTQPSSKILMGGKPLDPNNKKEKSGRRRGTLATPTTSDKKGESRRALAEMRDDAINCKLLH